MEKAVADIACLFSDLGNDADRTGSLRALGEALAPPPPFQLLLLDEAGNVLAVEDFGHEIDTEAAHRLSAMILDHLRGKGTCHFPLQTSPELHRAFAVRLQMDGETGIVGGVFDTEALNRQDFQVIQSKLACGGRLAWIAFNAALHSEELQTRVRHLLAEQIALKASHSEAINSAVKEHEERIQQQLSYDARLNSVLRAAADGILVTDETGIIDSFNPAAEQIFDYPAQEMLGQNIANLIPALGVKEDGDKVVSRWGIGPGMPSSSRREVDGVQKNGATRPLELAISSTWIDDQCVFTFIVHDITERRKAEQELHRLHLQNQMILDAAGEGIFGTDRQGRIIFANPAAIKMLGTTSEELIYKSAHDTIHHTRWDGTACPREENPLLKTIQDGQIRQLSSELFWNQNGTSFPVQCTCTPICEGAEIMGAVVTFSDVTERRLLEAQLTQAQKLESIGQLAAGVAHEINTPTQYIGDNVRFLLDAFDELKPVLFGFKELAAAKPEDNIMPSAEMMESMRRHDFAYLLREIPSAIEQSLEGVDRVYKIVRSMKEFSHPGSNHKQEIDLNRAIESTLTVARNEWKYVADLKLELDADLPLVTCLPGDLNQVFLNVIVNAAHAMESKLGDSPKEKGTLTVRTGREDDMAVIHIQDTGTGIPPNICDRVYDPFFTTKKVGRGTGQGLAIARSIVVDRHSGTITFETEVGQGTTFTIRIPIQPPSADEKGDNREEKHPLRK